MSRKRWEKKETVNGTSLTLLLSLLLICGCGGGEQPPRGVILIVVDTLRADHLGCYGYSRDTSPAVDLLAKDSLVFENCYSGAASTGPAMAGLMTGRYPGDVRVKSNFRNLPGRALTLAECLSETGSVKTGAVVSNYVLRSRGKKGFAGTEQGFTYYDDTTDETEKNRADYFERRATGTTDAAIKYLKGIGGESFFFWVHYQDPHGPYTPPRPFEGRFKSENDPAEEDLLQVNPTETGRSGIPNYQVLGQERRASAYIDRYDEEIAYFDSELSRLLQYIEERGWYDDCLIILTADHGESMGEHDHYFSHGEHAYREVVQVPLLIRYPKGMGQPKDDDGKLVHRWDGVTAHVDLWTTILDFMNAPAPPSRGESLYGNLPRRDRALLQEHRNHKNEETWFAMTDDRFRLIVDQDIKGVLVDYRKDPGETTDLSKKFPDEVVRLSEELSETLKAEGWKVRWLPSEEPPLSQKDIEILKSLGYVGDETEEDEDDKTKANEKGK